ncbi:MAG TPA: sulfotransferase [Geminicoccus sp.]|uniref:sulfotransferase family protein n=1 Tax=Geminicoccus sp. TaxID=2024832 RepID=UPI002E363456|nr:sulfotransferase [Geminicoccus sp.]HEX2526050.1 sulfotransferase [Geminicoccus sp.]
MLPNLFVIGAAKAGTTSLHHYLGQHPGIFMSPVKEPNFFAFSQSVPHFAGPDESGRPFFQQDRLRREKYAYSIMDRAEYERLFVQGKDKAYRGESSAAYLYFPGSAERIRALVPEARIIAVLRQPVERGYSKYQQMRRDLAEPLGSFAEAVKAEPARKEAGWAPTWLYLDRGWYGRQLAPYFANFPRHQVHVVLYEDLRRDPAACLHEIFTFLQLDPDVPVDMREQHNVSAVTQVPRFGLIYQMAVRPFLNSARLQSLIPEALVARIRPLARRFLLKQSAPVQLEGLSPELKAQLTAMFSDDIVQLQELIGRDLSHWVPPRASNEGHGVRLDQSDHLAENRS